MGHWPDRFKGVDLGNEKGRRVENEVELVEVLGRVHFYTNEPRVELRTDYGVL